jgi:hypothetical protein
LAIAVPTGSLKSASLSSGAGGPQSLPGDSGERSGWRNAARDERGYTPQGALLVAKPVWIRGVVGGHRSPRHTGPPTLAAGAWPADGRLQRSS